VESAHEYAIIMMNQEHDIVSWNSGAERIFGYEESEVLHRSADIFFTEEDREARAMEAEMETATREGHASSDRWQVRKDGTRFWASGVTTALRHGELKGFAKVLRDNTEQKRHQEQMQTTMHELSHRVKNTLAVVQAIAKQTARRCTSLEGFMSTFVVRLQSISKAHALLIQANWEGMALEQIIESELGSCSPSPERFVASGPKTTLPPNVALAFYMIIHELSTNALKHGALAVPEGTISIEWRDEHGGLVLEWNETVRGPLDEPSRTGFGSTLVRQIVEYELGGQLDRTYTPTGLRLRIRIPTNRDTDGLQTTKSGTRSPIAILVVEDVAILATRLADEIVSFGFSVVGPAATLDEAMSLLESESITAAVLDFDLNGTTTISLARSLRKRDIPFVFMTGYDQSALPEDLRDVPIFSKPVDSNYLKQFLDQRLPQSVDR
jgi:PAS domain S-box-containing protein